MDEPIEESLHGLIGQSESIRKLRRLAGKLGQSRWPVLLLGETGTGKEVVARAIYGANPLGPFVTIDCSSLVGPLMESELFGHSKGAFTGAVANKLGMIELANGGTLSSMKLANCRSICRRSSCACFNKRSFARLGPRCSAVPISGS